jgi:hypothetical protein
MKSLGFRVSSLGFRVWSLEFGFIGDVGLELRV